MAQSNSKHEGFENPLDFSCYRLQYADQAGVALSVMIPAEVLKFTLPDSVRRWAHAKLDEAFTALEHGEFDEAEGE